MSIARIVTAVNPVSVRYGRLPDAMQRYSLGKSAMRQIAEAAGAIRKGGGSVLYDYVRIDSYIDQAGVIDEGPQNVETVES